MQKHDVLRQCRDVDTVREEIRSACPQQTDLLQPQRAEPPRGSDVSRGLIPALLVLTCAGGLLLVVHSIVGW